MLRTLPFLRLLAINLGAGIVVALLGIAGLLIVDPFGLRLLIMNDSAGAVALFLLTFGFVVTFGSCAMGTAIMTLAKR